MQLRERARLSRSSPSETKASGDAPVFRVPTRGKDTDRVSEAQNSLRETQAPG